MHCVASEVASQKSLFGESASECLRRNPSSLDAVKFWVEELQQRLSSCVIVVAANKADLLSCSAPTSSSEDEALSSSIVLSEEQRSQARIAMEVESLDFFLTFPFAEQGRLS